MAKSYVAGLKAARDHLQRSLTVYEGDAVADLNTTEGRKLASIKARTLALEVWSITQMVEQEEKKNAS